MSNVEILSPKFKVVKIITKFEKKASWENWNYLDIVTYYATNGKEIFVAKNSEKEYCINVYNLNGNKIYTIKKNYRKKKIDKDEYKALNAFETKHHRPASKIEFKKAINGMFCDENGYLFVSASIDRNDKNKTDFILDVFKDGIFVNTVKLQNIAGYDFNNPDYKIYMRKNKIYLIDRNDLIVSSYTYKIVK